MISDKLKGNRKNSASKILQWQLRERIKELTALHKTAIALNRPGWSVSRTMRYLLRQLPLAWQYPEITGVRIIHGSEKYSSENFSDYGDRQKAEFKVQGGSKGVIEVCYLEQRPRQDEGPFLKEERLLINSLAVMIKSYFERKLYEEQQARAKRKLKEEVKKQTRALVASNQTLRRELRCRALREKQIKKYQEQLRSLVKKLTDTEETERREIASDLHDHLGQGLALLRQKVRTLHGNSVFTGLESELEEIGLLAEQAIRYTRSLTSELSPPAAYELHLESSLGWLADHFRQKYKLETVLSSTGASRELPLNIRITLFKAVRELLMNVVKHSQSPGAEIKLVWQPGEVEISVADKGIGLKTAAVISRGAIPEGFGLFNIRERISAFKGTLVLTKNGNRGTKAILKVNTSLSE